MERQTLTFTYRARDAKGAAESGVISARSQTEALRQLQRDGRTVTDIRLGEAAEDVEQLRTKYSAGSVSREDVIAFASQLAVMLETGVPLAEALHACTAQSRQSGLKRVTATIADRITGGASFSSAIAEYPKVFPRMMVSLMKASEASGKMGLMLSRVASYLGKERKTVRQIKGALTYPAVMVTLAIGITIFLVTFVLPRFAKIYESREAALPALTKFVLGMSKFISTNWEVLAFSASAVIAAAIVFRMTSFGRQCIDTFKIHAPIIGPMFTKFYLTRATRTLGTLLASGVTLLEAVRIVRGVTENRLWLELWDETERAMTGGQSIVTVLSTSKLIPPAISSMIAAGDRTGKLPEVLERVAQTAEEELDEAIKNATQLIEPLMIMFMGVTIGGIAIALLLPIFSVANVMAGK